MILQIVGFKNSGKTTLMMHTINKLKSLKLKVATIKHHGHTGSDIELQGQHVDHMKHFESGRTKALYKGMNIDKL